MIYFLLAVTVFLLYALFENLIVLTVRHEKLGSGIRIVHLSDLHKRHFGEGNSRLCRKVRAEKPDIIIFSGDLVSRSIITLSNAEAALRELCEIAPVYMIYGNHEQSISEEMRGELEAMFERNKQIMLKNQHTTVNIRGRVLKIYGLMEHYGVYKKNGSYRDLDVIDKAYVEDKLGKCPDGEVLLIAHNPFFGKAYAEWGADYTFSGHVHGGIVRLFGVAMLSPERKFFPEYSKGVYDFGGKKLLVSAGLGKLRLFCPPEIVVYEI
ncbi:metallophosphoesterase [Ruminococcus sp.]|uniref:metallophosphoesterase n=1 Tax=Ruminococcus sp. TaxID=41978 RepID=UPI0025F71B67|nr:metallophosphoesterase [Ruminococcus sp.]MCR4639963.1 metallophosphoesterase [Ruminococcus sp.]